MTDAIQREFSAGLVHFEGKAYEAVVVYKGDSRHVPAAFSAVGRVNEIYRRTIQDMLDQPFCKSSEWGSLVEISKDGEHFEQSGRVVEHTDPAIWTRFIASLRNPLPTTLPPVNISIGEYRVFEGLYNRLRTAIDPIVYTYEERRLFAKLQIPAKTDPRDSDFRFTVTARYAELQSQLTEELYPTWKSRSAVL